MKVLILASQLHSGAAELLAVELAVDLNMRGIHTDVVCMYSEDMEWARLAKGELLRRGVPNVHFLGLSVRPSIVELIGAIFRLRNLLLRVKADIIETSSPPLGIMASLACLGTRVFHIVGLHQTFYRWEHRSIREQMFSLCARLRKRTGFYAVSEFVKKTWIEYSSIQSSRVRVVHNCIAVARDESEYGKSRAEFRREFCISEKSKIVLCVGRLASYKRQDIVLDALGPICDERNLVVLFVGATDLFVPGTKEMLQRMKENIEANGLDSRVKFLGHRPDIYKLMVSADILVHATGKEAFGLVLAEAMALGLPIVATRVEGVPEVVRDTDSILVPPNDPAILRDAVLKTLALSPDQVANARAKGKLRAQKFSQSARSEEILALFEDALLARL